MLHEIRLPILCSLCMFARILLLRVLNMTEGIKKSVVRIQRIANKADLLADNTLRDQRRGTQRNRVQNILKTVRNCTLPKFC